jgi:hypothetical protein
VPDAASADSPPLRATTPSCRFELVELELAPGPTSRLLTTRSAYYLPNPAGPSSGSERLACRSHLSLVAGTSLHVRFGGATDFDVGGSLTLQTGQAAALSVGTMLDARIEGAKPRDRLARARSEAHRTAILDVGGPLNTNGAVINFD